MQVKENLSKHKLCATFKLKVYYVLSCSRVFENFLLSTRPAFGLPKYYAWKSRLDAKRPVIGGEYKAVRTFDECFTAYHR